jgi:hypothetical protein
MKIVTREFVRGPNGECKACGIMNRSHILEPATYEEYEIVTEDEHEEYQVKFKEETGEEEIELRYRLFERPTVMCHRCWVKFRDAQVELLIGNENEWGEKISEYIPEIKMFLKRWKYHKFAHECEREVLDMVKGLRKTMKEVLLNVE